MAVATSNFITNPFHLVSIMAGKNQGNEGGISATEAKNKVEESQETGDGKGVREARNASIVKPVKFLLEMKLPVVKFSKSERLR